MFNIRALLLGRFILQSILFRTFVGLASQMGLAVGSGVLQYFSVIIIKWNERIILLYSQRKEGLLSFDWEFGMQGLA